MGMHETCHKLAVHLSHPCSPGGSHTPKSWEYTSHRHSETHPRSMCESLKNTDSFIFSLVKCCFKSGKIQTYQHANVIQ